VVVYICGRLHFIKEIKKLALLVLLSYISTWEFLRTLDKCEKHSGAPRASLCTSLVFLKIPACLYSSTMHSGEFFISLVMKMRKANREKRLLSALVSQMFFHNLNLSLI